MRDIYLHGHLAEKFGSQHCLEVGSAAEAIKALCIIYKDFRPTLIEGSYRVIRGDDLESGMDITIEAIGMKLGRPALHIVPEIHGSGRGAGKAILGIALIAGAFYLAPAVVGAVGPTLGMGTTAFSIGSFSVTWANVATFGLSMALTGISAMFSPMPKAGDLSAISADQRPSWLFNGPVQNIEQGGIVPVWYGEIEVGSTVVSAGLEIEQI